MVRCMFAVAVLVAVFCWNVSSRLVMLCFSCFKLIVFLKHSLRFVKLFFYNTHTTRRWSEIKPASAQSNKHRFWDRTRFVSGPNIGNLAVVVDVFLWSSLAKVWVQLNSKTGIGHFKKGTLLISGLCLISIKFHRLLIVLGTKKNLLSCLKMSTISIIIFKKW